MSFFFWQPKNPLCPILSYLSFFIDKKTFFTIFKVFYLHLSQLLVMKILLCLLLSVLLTSCDGDLLRVSDSPKFAFLFCLCVMGGAFLGYLATFRIKTNLVTNTRYVVRKKTIPYLCGGGILGAIFAYFISLI